MTMPKLDNAIFISGAGQRIGAYIAEQFLLQGQYPVIFSYRTKRPAVQKLLDMGAIGIQADFTDTEQLNRLITEVKACCHSLRAVIHNASIWLSDEQAPVGSTAYQSLFQVHVAAPQAFNEAFNLLLLKSDSPLKDIISLSDYSVDRIKASHIGYLASKAALRTLTVGYAKKLAPDIKANDIAPSLIIFNEGDSDEYKKARLANAALPIEPGEQVVWQAIQYLMNNCYTTGSSLRLDGGRFIM